MAAAAKPKGLYDALLAVQKAGISLQKNAINPHFKNRYISLDSLMEQVLPVLNDNGLVLLQAPANINGVPALTTEIIHVTSGETRTSTMPLILEKENSQGQGSAITYARRYSLMSILGLVADTDDDGSKASQPSEAALKRRVMALGKERTGLERPTAAQIAEVFGVEPGELSDRATLERILKDES